MNMVLRISCIPLMLGLLVGLIGLTIGWNLITLFIFWFLIIPILSLRIPRRLSKNEFHWMDSALGISIFYAVMILMIYEHYQTNYFKVMMISFFVNIIMIIVKATRRPRIQSNV